MSEQIDRWTQRVNELVAQVETWLQPREEWVTKRYPKRMRDEDRKVFEVPALFLQKGPSRLLLDPIAYDVPGSEGAVDIYLMPTYDDMASLYLVDGRWEIHYVFHSEPMEINSMVEAEPLPLSEETLNRVLNEIADHAVPSV